MNDWKSIARATGVSSSETELDALTAPLISLEQTFRPLIRELTPDLDPAVAFNAEEEAE